MWTPTPTQPARRPRPGRAGTSIADVANEAAGPLGTRSACPLTQFARRSVTGKDGGRPRSTISKPALGGGPPCRPHGKYALPKIDSGAAPGARAAAASRGNLLHRPGSGTPRIGLATHRCRLAGRGQARQHQSCRALFDARCRADQRQRGPPSADGRRDRLRRQAAHRRRCGAAAQDGGRPGKRSIESSWTEQLRQLKLRGRKRAWAAGDDGPAIRPPRWQVRHR